MDTYICAGVDDIYYCTEYRRLIRHIIKKVENHSGLTHETTIIKPIWGYSCVSEAAADLRFHGFHTFEIGYFGLFPILHGFDSQSFITSKVDTTGTLLSVHTRRGVFNP